jgi:hypothetical protein
VVDHWAGAYSAADPDGMPRAEPVQSRQFLEESSERDPPLPPIESPPVKHDLATTMRRSLERASRAQSVASDSGEDHAYKFSDLGNAIEKCRADLGVSIEELDLEPLELQGSSDRSARHFSVGRIRYSDADGPTAPDGILLYLKSSLTGDEPTDVSSYKADHPMFPHQSTSDQWFDESQFESYRALGHHVATKVFEELGDFADPDADWQDQIRGRP